MPGYAITADWHHPIVNDKLIQRLFDQSRDEKIKKLYIVGDWFNQDHWSNYDPKQPDANIEAELESSTHYMNECAKIYSEITFIEGNHDIRILKKLGYTVSFSTAMSMLFHDLSDRSKQRLRFVEADHEFLELSKTKIGRYSSNQITRWLLAHPKEYSRIPLRVPRELAGIHFCNVLVGHSHHTASGFDRSGKLVCGELGGFFDADNFDYKKSTTTFPEWQPGYAILRDNNTLEMQSGVWSQRS